MICRVIGANDSDKVSFLNGEGLEVAYVKVRNNLCEKQFSSINRLYSTSCLSKGSDRGRQFGFRISAITVEQLLSNWSCSHEVLGQSNFVRLTPFGM